MSYALILSVCFWLSSMRTAVLVFKVCEIQEYYIQRIYLSVNNRADCIA